MTKAPHVVSRSATGIYHAEDPDGRDLPLIDVTHPAFAVNLSESELTALTNAHAQETARREKYPRWLQKLMFRVFLRHSVLAASLRQAEGGFLDGLSTYRLKLGAENLDPSWAGPADRRIAASLPCLSLRLRLQDMAEFLADNLAPRLATRPGEPLSLVNIAGGPSMDSVNALLLLQKRNAALLRDRPVHISILDQDDAGPAFAVRALSALRGPGAPLGGLDITMAHLPYRWDEPKRLRGLLAQLPEKAVTAVSSEGGLFDYGSDAEIVANLEVLRECLPEDTVVTGSVTRANAPGESSRTFLRFATRPRELPAFDLLVARAHWLLERTRIRPFSFNVLLNREKSPA